MSPRSEENIRYSSLYTTHQCSTTFKTPSSKTNSSFKGSKFSGSLIIPCSGCFCGISINYVGDILCTAICMTERVSELMERVCPAMNVVCLCTHFIRIRYAEAVVGLMK